MNSTITELKVLISDTILDSDTSRGFHIPKVKSYLTNSQIKDIESFIENQKNQGVNFKKIDDDKDEVDIKGQFEASKILYDYYKSIEKIPRSDIKNLLYAIKTCAKHIKRFDGFDVEVRKLLDIQDKKYFHEYDLEEYRFYFNEPFVQNLKKQSSKYPVLLFNEVITALDGINKKGYKNKQTRLSQELKKLILKIFNMQTKVLRVEDKKEYEIDIKYYREAIKFYFEIVRCYIGNESIIGSKEITLDNLESIVATAYPLKNYERLCITEENYLKKRSLIKRLELYKILTTDTKEEAKKVIAEIEAECLEMIERQPFLHGLNIEDEELFYSVVKQIQTIEQCEKLNE